MTTPDDTTQISWSGLTHTGRVRKGNEDAFLALQLIPPEFQFLGKFGEAPALGRQFLFAVSDGMGGANAGRFASRVAVEKITEVLPTLLLAKTSTADAREEMLKGLFAQIHQRMQSLSFFYSDVRGMGATLTVAWIVGESLVFSHVGDSRLYHLPASGTCFQLSEDHSHVGYLVRQGQLSEIQARTHPKKNILTQALGGNVQQIRPQTGQTKFAPGDRLCLCSDGVTDGISTRLLESLLREPPSRIKDQRPADRIVNEALSESGRDNITAVVVEHLK